MGRYFWNIIFYSLAGAFFGGGLAYGADEIITRVDAQPGNPWVGQKVVLELDVLALDGWAQLRKVHNTEIQGGYLQRFETQGTRLYEEIDGAGYTGQRYEYLFFPQQGGDITIPAITIDVEIKSWGQDGKTQTQRLSTQPIVLNVRRPPGVKSVQGLLSTIQFSATQKWEPEKQNLSLGDAVARTITRKAADISGMAFSPVTQTETAGVGIYPSEPVVDDMYSRGTLTGQRIEKVTYVMEQNGRYSVPDLEFTWWNTKAETLETISLPGLTLEVSGSAVEHGEPGSVVNPERWSGSTFLVIAAAVILIGAVIMYLFKSRILRYFQVRKRKRAETEKNYFKKVRTAAHNCDTKTMLNATMRWLDRVSTETLPARLDLFLERYGDPGSEKIVAALWDQSSSGQDNENVRNLFDALTKARSKWLEAQRRRKKAEGQLPEVALSGQRDG